MITNTANCVKYNYFRDDDGIVMSRCDFENSQISLQKHTVGIAGDDVMYYIQVWSRNFSSEAPAELPAPE